MDQEFGQKLLDDFTLSDLLMGKDRVGPHFESKETDAAYILIAHLKGYYRESIKVEISQDGTYIAITGSKPVQETFMVVGWKVPKRDVTMRGYRKVFRIPDEVVSDKIHARYDKSKSILTISMAKAVKGLSGIEIEEVKEGETPGERFSTLQISEDDVIAELETPREIRAREGDTEGGRSMSGVLEKDDRTTEKEESADGDQSGQAEPAPERRSKICVPIMAGSALLVSVIVFVIHMVRTKNQAKKKKH